jgi:hypothetical protein
MNFLVGRKLRERRALLLDERGGVENENGHRRYSTRLTPCSRLRSFRALSGGIFMANRLTGWRRGLAAALLVVASLASAQGHVSLAADQARRPRIRRAPSPTFSHARLPSGSPRV